MQTPLTLEEVRKFIQANKYAVNDNGNSSRCIDGRYKKAENLPPLAKPGADVGDLLMLFAVNRQYNLGVTAEKLVEVLIEILGGWNHFQSHTDSHHLNSEELFFGCGHFNQSYHSPEAFSLAAEDTAYILKLLEEHKDEIQHTTLEGEHLERAVVVVKGNTHSVYPLYDPSHITDPVFNTPTEVFVYHKTLDNERRRKLGGRLLPEVTVPDITEEYLYEVMSQVADDQLLEIVSRLAPKLSLYTVNFTSDGMFEITE